MKKSLIIIGIAVGVIAVPFIGMSISPTRSLIMGLASDEAVLELADEIDKSRIENEQKLTELQSQISDQQQVADEQKKEIDEQDSKIKDIECQKLREPIEKKLKSAKSQADIERENVEQYKKDVKEHCDSDDCGLKDSLKLRKELLKEAENDIIKYSSELENLICN